MLSVWKVFQSASSGVAIRSVANWTLTFRLVRNQDVPEKVVPVHIIRSMQRCTKNALLGKVYAQPWKPCRIKFSQEI